MQILESYYELDLYLRYQVQIRYKSYQFVSFLSEGRKKYA